MAGLEGLVSIIYHEKQQPGSMLCAQHSLNSLLQGPYFTAPDLSEIALRLDGLEEEYNAGSQRGGSKNMDDTGFFSVQVVEEAIEVLGLRLVRWRSNAMRPYQDHPHTQLGFILNLEQHWFTLRRFGPASAHIDEDTGEGHWFNLNSFLSAPEWVGKLYLGMVLQQAEAEGYSVFAVTQADPSKPLALPRTEADDIAATLPEPQSASQSSVYNVAKRATGTFGPTREDSGSGSRLQESEEIDKLGGVEDNDYELQAALQASLESQEDYGSSFYEDDVASPPTVPPPAAASSSRADSSVASGSTSTTSSSHSSQQLNLPAHANLDPVATSMERNRVLLQRMREQQEFAQRELWSANGLMPEQQAQQDARRQERQRQEEEEAEQLRQAIIESEAMARERQERGEGQPSHDTSTAVLSNRGQADSDITSFDHTALDDRNYDDEDAELQAALRASLENILPGWQRPEVLPPNLPKDPELPSQSDRGTTPTKNTKEPYNMDVDEDEEWHSESESSNLGDVASEKSDRLATTQQSATSLAEIRQARLARFGS